MFFIFIWNLLSSLTLCNENHMWGPVFNLCSIFYRDHFCECTTILALKLPEFKIKLLHTKSSDAHVQKQILFSFKIYVLPSKSKRNYNSCCYMRINF